MYGWQGIDGQRDLAGSLFPILLPCASLPPPKNATTIFFPSLYRRLYCMPVILEC